MPWKESRIVNERVKFLADVLKGEESITELCLHCAISRKTGYKWMARFQETDLPDWKIWGTGRKAVLTPRRK
jgi:transposase